MNSTKVKSTLDSYVASNSNINQMVTSHWFFTFSLPCTIRFNNDIVGCVQVTLVELSKSSPSLPELLSGIGSSVIGIDTTLKQLMEGLTLNDGVQARMDGIMFERSEGSSFANPIFNLLKDYLSSL